MSDKKQEMIQKCATDIQEKWGQSPDMNLLEKVTTACGPSIYNADAATVAGSDKAELETVKNNFLIGKLGLSDGPELDEAISSVIQTYGSATKNKWRPVVYYALTKHFKKEDIYS